MMPQVTAREACAAQRHPYPTARPVSAASENVRNLLAAFAVGLFMAWLVDWIKWGVA